MCSISKYVVEGPEAFHDQILDSLLSIKNASVISMLSIIQDTPNTCLEELFNAALEEKSSINTSNLLTAVLNAKIVSMFYKINVHGDMTSSEIKNELSPAITQAANMLAVYNKLHDKLFDQPQERAITLSASCSDSDADKESCTSQMRVSSESLCDDNSNHYLSSDSVSSMELNEFAVDCDARSHTSTTFINITKPYVTVS